MLKNTLSNLHIYFEKIKILNAVTYECTLTSLTPLNSPGHNFKGGKAALIVCI